MNVICCLFHVKNFLLVFLVQATFTTQPCCCTRWLGLFGTENKTIYIGILGTKTKPSKTMLCLQLLLNGEWRDEMKTTSSDQSHEEQSASSFEFHFTWKYENRNERFMQMRKFPMTIFVIFSRMIKIAIFARIENFVAKFF